LPGKRHDRANNRPAPGSLARALARPRSILTMSSGRSRNCDRLDQPAPKSSSARRKPAAR
jgi:hypothetical protein